MKKDLPSQDTLNWSAPQCNIRDYDQIEKEKEMILNTLEFLDEVERHIKRMNLES